MSFASSTVANSTAPAVPVVPIEHTVLKEEVTALTRSLDRFSGATHPVIFICADTGFNVAFVRPMHCATVGFFRWLEEFFPSWITYKDDVPTQALLDQPIPPPNPTLPFRIRKRNMIDFTLKVADHIAAESPVAAAVELSVHLRKLAVVEAEAERFNFWTMFTESDADAAGRIRRAFPNCMRVLFTP